MTRLETRGKSERPWHGRHSRSVGEIVCPRIHYACERPSGLGEPQRKTRCRKASGFCCCRWRQTCRRWHFFAEESRQVDRAGS